MNIRKGDIYYADLTPVIGSEQGGIRPVLIIQNDIGNRHSPTVIAAAITSRKEKHPLPTHVPLKGMHGLKQNSTILLEQIRTIDRSRLLEYIGQLEPKKLQVVDRGLVVSFGINIVTQ